MRHFASKSGSSFSSSSFPPSSLFFSAALVFSLIAAISVLGAIYTLSQISTEDAVAAATLKYERNIRDLTTKLNLSQRSIAVEASSIRSSLAEFALARDAGQKAIALADVAQRRSKLNSEAKSAKEISEGFKDIELTNAFSQIEVLAAALWSDDAEAARQEADETFPAGEKLLKDYDSRAAELMSGIEKANIRLATIVEIQDQYISHAAWKIDWARANAITNTQLVTFWTVVACFLGVAAVSVRITNPLVEITRALKRLTLRDLNRSFLDLESRSDEIGDLARAYNEFRDIILDHVEAQKKLSEQQALLESDQRQIALLAARFDVALSAMPLGLLMLNRDRRILVLNWKARELLEINECSSQPDRDLREMLNCSSNAGCLGFEGVDQVEKAVDQFLTLPKETSFHIKTQQERLLEFSLHAGANDGILILLEDISVRHKAETEIHQLAWFDPLTGLPNRRLMFRVIDEALAQNAGLRSPLALLYIDLDHFKEVNDTQGHSAGDELLRGAAERLRSVVRASDMVARIGGDEFVILQRDVCRMSDIETLARRIIDAFENPFEIGGQEVRVGASIGVAKPARNKSTRETLMREADTALYRAKADGRNAWRFFRPSMHAAAVARRNLEFDLRDAIRAKSLDVYFQPILRADNQEISACEALTRWRHPTRGPIPPAEFIPFAEEVGLISALGAQTLEDACRACASWPGDIRVAVNVSPSQFEKGDLIGDVEKVLADLDLSPSRLEIEITESVLIGDTERTKRSLQQLRSLGVGVALDDFGAGYSSLSYLHHFPFDRVKIDRSFLSEASGSARARSLLRGIVRLAADLGIGVVVEGVETTQHFQLVREECPSAEVQGFLFSPPVPARSLGELFCRDGRRKVA
jgi:diguanylate cyclase (GGDEF)-like protein